MKISLQAVEAQVQAMGTGLFEVGACTACPQAGEPQGLLRTWDSDTLLRSLSWLRFQNLRGRHIYIRPKGEHSLNLLDDLKLATLTRMIYWRRYPGARSRRSERLAGTAPGNCG